MCWAPNAPSLDEITDAVSAYSWADELRGRIREQELPMREILSLWERFLCQGKTSDAGFKAHSPPSEPSVFVSASANQQILFWAVMSAQDREAKGLWPEPSDTMSQNKYFPKLFLSVFGHHYAKVTKTPSYCLYNLKTGLSPSHTITHCLKPRCGDLTPLGKSKQTSLRKGLLC